MATLHFLRSFLILLAVLPFTAFAEGNGPSGLTEKVVTYKAGGLTAHSFVVFDSNIKGKRPAVLVVPEWWGLNDYARMRARQLAELGYIAMAVDMFGDGKTAANPGEAQKLTAPYYKDPSLTKEGIDAAIIEIKNFPETDPSHIAAIGYCFGGYVVLNAAKLGSALKGVVSFHGGMGGAPVVRGLLKASILVCHGDSDKFVPMSAVEKFHKQLDSIGAKSTFKIFPDATHAFTNPASTETGKKFNMPIRYNPEAAKEAWGDMRNFLAGVFKK
ncbi:MAG TPA: dienelactone hydrolase family protein [Bacteroidales bacterium]|nr:dienelactone hydrolase family protein [Bacteroidales bacterium]